MKKILLVLFSVLFIINCSDEIVSPEPGPDSFNIVGNWKAVEFGPLQFLEERDGGSIEINWKFYKNGNCEFTIQFGGIYPSTEDTTLSDTYTLTDAHLLIVPNLVPLLDWGNTSDYVQLDILDYQTFSIHYDGNDNWRFVRN